uniref:aECM cysteine-cradle domain-containing protein n=1 Tax=Setaria digitata TaxID=48799 RepID=A0A915PJ94_9BILA
MKELKNPFSTSWILSSSAENRSKLNKGGISSERGPLIEVETMMVSGKNGEDPVPQRGSTVFLVQEHSTDGTKGTAIENVENLANDLKVPHNPFAPVLQSDISDAGGSESELFDNDVSSAKVINPLETQRKMLEARRRALFLEMESENYADEENRKEMESSKGREEKENNEIINSRLLQEKARLEKARLLREEQIKLRKQQELQHGFFGKAQLRRQQQIAEQLEQLAESERQHREQLEREKQIKFARMKHGGITRIGSRPTAETRINVISKPINQGGGNLLPAIQCSMIQKFVRIFRIVDPIEWIRVNCPLAKIHLPRASCERAQELFESCFQ